MNTTRLDELSELADSPHALIQHMTMRELWNLQMIPPSVSENLWDHAAACIECSVKMHEARVEQLAAAPEHARLAAHAFAKGLLAGSSTAATQLNEQTGTIRRQPEAIAALSLPEIITDAGLRLYDAIPNFLDRLIGFSRVGNAIPAAAGSITLSARLNRFRGGDIHLTLERKGPGTLRGSFKYPDSLLVGVYDSNERRLLDIMRSDDLDAGKSNSVKLNNTDARPIRLRIVWPETSHGELVLLVWR
jgi:hypothetical protein